MNVAKRILIVDDDEEVVELTASILAQEGYEVTGATSGAEGIEKAFMTSPDLILLDVNMPEMDGWEVLRALKVAEETRHILVAIFTVRTEARDKIYSLQKGAFDYITTPFTCDELTQRVRRIFDLSGGRAPAGSPSAGSLGLRSG